MRKLVFSVSLLCVLSLLSACGFTLRGSTKTTLPSQLQTIQLQSSAGNSAIIQATRRALSSSGIKVIDESQEGVYQLGLGTEQISERVISVNSSARAGEYELTMTLPFQLESNSSELSTLASGNTFIIEPETLTTQRNYQADPQNATAKAEEAELIRNEMRLALVNQILRQLQNVSF